MLVHVILFLHEKSNLKMQQNDRKLKNFSPNASVSKKFIFKSEILSSNSKPIENSFLKQNKASIENAFIKRN